MADCVPSSFIRALLLIENRLLRESLVRVFRKRSDLEVVGQGSPADQSSLEILDTQYNVLVGDAFLAGRLRAGFTAKSGMPAGSKIVLVGMEPGEEHFIAAVRSGVSGYLLQDASASDVVAAVRAVCRGEAVCPTQLCCVLFRFVAQMTGELPHPHSTSKPDLTMAPAAIGSSCGQRSHQQRNRLAAKSFRVHSEESYSQNLETGGRRKSERSSPDNSRIRLLDQFLTVRCTL